MAALRRSRRVFRLQFLIITNYVVLLSCIATADAQAQNDTNAPMEDLVYIYWGDCPSVAESPNEPPTAVGASATHGHN
jgi:hypothetical protein